MHVALSLAVLVAVVLAVSGVCRKLDLPTPLVLVAVGALGSFVPFVPEVHLSAEVVLVGLLPPLLYATALQTSLVDFNAHRRAILLLSIGLVGFTTLGVGVVAHLVVPGLSWPAAFALGAVVAPPDAVAATAIARRVGMPRSIVTVLEGESLLNDATALVALRTSVGAASAGAVSVGRIGLDFLVAAVGGVLAGLLAYVVVGWVRKHLTEPVLDTGVSFVTPFLAYAAAESVHASGVLAVVVAGLLLGHNAPLLQTASSRIAERLTWRTIAFLLENAVFLLIGLQARWIITEVVDSGVGAGVVVSVCAATVVTVVLLRLVWVFPARYLLLRPGPDPHSGERPSAAYTAAIGWAGMRGVVTLAAAFAIPVSFAHRDLLVLVALVVTAATLFGQGSTLPWLVRRLRLPAPDARDDALARAALFEKATAAGLATLGNHADEDAYDTVAALRRRTEQRDQAAWERLGGTAADVETPSETYARLRLEMLRAEREKVLQVRSSGTVPHEVVADVLAALDVEESMLDIRAERRDSMRDPERVTRAPASAPGCIHLADARNDTVPNVDGVCEDCVAQGWSVWVHLRLCLECGHVGCCDSSPRRHATAHFHDTGHPVIRSAEPAEDWRWCYVDNRLG